MTLSHSGVVGAAGVSSGGGAVADPVFVNGTGIYWGGSGPVDLPTPALATTTGNFIFVLIEHYTVGTTIVGATDTAGNAYVKAGTTQGGDATHQAEIWFTPAPITGNAANVVTAEFTGVQAYVGVGVGQFSWSGVSSVAFDAEATLALSGPGGGGAGTSVSNAVQTTAQNDLVIGGFGAWEAARTVTNGSGTIAWQDAATCNLALAYRNTDAPGAYTIGVSVAAGGANGTYTAIAKAFKGVV